MHSCIKEHETLLHELGDPLQTAAALAALQWRNSAPPWSFPLTQSKFWALTSLLSHMQSGIMLQTVGKNMKSTSEEVCSYFPARED